MTSGKFPLLHLHKRLQNLNTSSTLTASYFEERNLVLSLWAIQKLSKPQHARQMHGMFGRQMTLVIFVVLRSVPEQWNDNRGLFEEFVHQPVWVLGWTQSFIRAQQDLYKANYLASHLHFGHLAHSCWQTYWLWWGEQTYDPSWCGTTYSISPAAAIWINLSVVIGGLSLTMRGEHDEDKWRTLREVCIPLPALAYRTLCLTQDTPSNVYFPQ